MLPRARSPLTTTVASMAACSALVLGGACAGSGGEAKNGGEIECAPPIGVVAREDCASVARDYAFEVDLALSAPQQKSEHAAAATAALKRASELGTSIKDARVALCEKHNACGVAPPAFVDAEAKLSGAFQALITLWDQRRLADPASVSKFQARLEEVATQAGVELPEHGATQPTKAENPKPQQAVIVAGATLVRGEPAAGAVTVKKSGTAVVATTEGKGSEAVEVLRANLANRGVTAGRALARVIGKFAPKEPPLFAPGDALVVRLEARATEAAQLVVAVRSIEDEELTSRVRDAAEVEQVLSFAKGEKGKREVKLMAPADSAGLYVSIGPRLPQGGKASQEAKPVDLDRIEILRGGALVLEARAEKDDPRVLTRCALSNKAPLEGKKSYSCKAEGVEAIQLGFPSAYVSLAVAAPGEKPRSPLLLTTLEGGRTLEVPSVDASEFIAAVTGAGTLTIERLDLVPRP